MPGDLTYKLLSFFPGIGYAMSLLGPAIGYVLGGQLLNVYVDFNRQVRQGSFFPPTLLPPLY